MEWCQYYRFYMHCKTQTTHTQFPSLICSFVFRANYLCFGLQSVWFHATNVLLHAAATLLFTRVCLCVAGLKPPFATLAGLLFAAHPIHTEAVSFYSFISKTYDVVNDHHCLPSYIDFKRFTIITMD